MKRRFALVGAVGLSVLAGLVAGRHYPLPLSGDQRSTVSEAQVECAIDRAIERGVASKVARGIAGSRGREWRVQLRSGGVATVILWEGSWPQTTLSEPLFAPVGGDFGGRALAVAGPPGRETDALRTEVLTLPPGGFLNKGEVSRCRFARKAGR